MSATAIQYPLDMMLTYLEKTAITAAVCPKRCKGTRVVRSFARPSALLIGLLPQLLLPLLLLLLLLPSLVNVSRQGRDSAIHGGSGGGGY